MHFSRSKLDGPILVEPDVFPDDRGYFKETYSSQKYAENGIGEVFVQDNVSISHRGVLRGMHYDSRMAKLVQCLDGEIFDVVVDMREDSPSYLKWDSFILSGENHRQLYVPAGFAHGFYVKSERAIVSYKQSALYDPQYERAVRWNDPRIGIAWPAAAAPVLSAKDASC